MPNSVLIALPIYFLYFFRILDKVVDKLVNIQRRFLWGGGLEQRKIAWVNWKTVCLPRDKGGLGIKDLRAFNTALLAKWKCELFHQHGDMWGRILISKYGGWRALDDARRSSHLSYWWKGLLQINHQQHAATSNYQQSILDYTKSLISNIKLSAVWGVKKMHMDQDNWAREKTVGTTREQIFFFYW